MRFGRCPTVLKGLVNTIPRLHGTIRLTDGKDRVQDKQSKDDAYRKHLIENWFCSPVGRRDNLLHNRIQQVADGEGGQDAKGTQNVGVDNGRDVGLIRSSHDEMMV
jgi:hypothetical protein